MYNNIKMCFYLILRMTFIIFYLKFKLIPYKNRFFEFKNYNYKIFNKFNKISFNLKI